MKLNNFFFNVSTAYSYSGSRQITAPVLLMSGHRDVIIPTHILEIYSALPKAQLCVLPGSTHFALRQNPTVFNETILRFFTEPFEMPKSF